MPVPRSVLVTGGNRGIGLGFVQHYLGLKDVQHVFATARDPETAEDLKAIKDARFHAIKMDVQCDESINAAEKKVASIVGDSGLSLLINNSGVLPRTDLNATPDRKAILDCLDVNVAGPIVVTQAFLPLLRKAAAAASSLPVSIARAGIVNISSGAASIQDNASGGMLVYRTSKTALNSLTKTMSLHVDKDDILCLAILPGYVVTRMTGQRGELTVEQSVGMVTTALDTFTREHQGGFFGKDGKPFPY